VRLEACCCARVVVDAARKVATHLKGPVLRVELHVEERALVRPRDAPSRPADLLLHLHAAAQLLEPHRVRLVPRPTGAARRRLRGGSETFPRIVSVSSADPSTAYASSRPDGLVST